MTYPYPEVPFPKYLFQELNQIALRKISGPHILDYQLFLLLLLLFFAAMEHLRLLLNHGGCRVRESGWRIGWMLGGEALGQYLTHFSQGVSQRHDR